MLTRMCLTLGVVALLIAGCLHEPPPTPVPPADSGGSGTVAAPDSGGSGTVAEPAAPAEPATPTPEPASPEPAAPPVGLELNPPMPVEPATPPGEAAANPPATEPAAPGAGDTERVKAEAGVGQRGRSLDPHEGLIVTPAKAYFTIRERIVFETLIPNALKLYDAATGSMPKTHEEFMAKVIEENKIELPELPAGQRYLWDPETKELMVERPAQ